MNYLNLSVIQKYDIFFTTILFVLFFLMLRPLFLSGEISSNNIIALGLIFFVTLGMTFIFTNSVSFNKLYTKLKSENI